MKSALGTHAMVQCVTIVQADSTGHDGKRDGEYRRNGGT